MSPAPHLRDSPTIIDIRQNSATRPNCSGNEASASVSDDEKENDAPYLGLKPQPTLDWTELADNNNRSGQAVSQAESRAADGSPSSGSSVSSDGQDGDGTETDFSLQLASSIIKGLTPGNGEPKSIPTVVLYDDKGLQIYDKITYLEEYYLVQEEIDILERDSDNIVDLIPDNSVVVELGSGSLRKTRVLLNALELKRQNIRYYALDLMRDELTKSLVSLGGYKNVTTAGLWGTYDEGMAFISSFPSEVPKTILWLGSSIGNMTRAEAREFISNYRDRLNVGDNWLIGIDRRNSPKDITLAYNDTRSVTREFIMNGLDHVNVLLQQPLVDRSNFDYFGRYNDDVGRHEAYYRALVAHELTYYTQDGTRLRISIEKDELINVEYSYKWSLAESSQLFHDTKMAKIGHWASPSRRYDLHMLRKVPFFQSNAPICPSPLPWIPSMEDWTELWKAWNMVTMEMISHPGMLMEKPIDLRLPFIFYIGHIPTFLDIQLSRVYGEGFTEPADFARIFERGIDPDVDDPSKCHEHSSVPETWPEVGQIIRYRDQVIARLQRFLSNTAAYPMTRRTARALFMAFEHQAMHLETILYMLVQSPNTRPPGGVSVPWAGGVPCTLKLSTAFPPASWITINPKECSLDILALGHEDLETGDGVAAGDVDTPFGWDNEHPLVVPSSLPPQFQIQSRQVTNGEYWAFLENTKMEMGLPKSWICEDGNFFVRSVFGKVPMLIAKGWPVCCSQREALAYAAWMDPSGKTLSLPTEHQLSIAFKLKQGGVNGLLNCNYGFKAWYPLPSLAEHPVQNSEMDSFQGPGALWDWTSTPFEPLSDGYVTSEIYPGYSADFFDGKHFVVLGASWATHPRIAERRSFRNWYQGNYDYAFIGFRLVRISGEAQN